MKYLSLFSGIGGFELGIQQAYEDLSTKKKKKQFREEDEKTVRVKKNKTDNEGDQGLGGSGTELQQHNINSTTRQPTCIGYSEIDKYAIQVYNKHFNHKNYEDITKIDPAHLPSFEMLVGGFPCQAFSIAGKRRGFRDTRGTLFFEIARIIREKQPRLLLLENVKGLLSHDKGHTFTTIIATLDELGYDCQWQVLNSKNFGVPQNRERVFIIGHLRGTSRPEVFPIGENDKVSDEPNGSNETRTQTKLSTTVRIGMGTKADSTFAVKDAKIRRLTPRECERLQGFPDDWTLNGTEGAISDTQRYKMCGNAVTVNVIKEIMGYLIRDNQ
jgi:DNA (cytosine-5)-methyltransferase 1